MRVMKPLRVLVGCEFSGIVRDAFIARGHDAMSCDLLPTETPGPHYQGDVRDVLDDGFDLAIFHPPCTHLAVSGARHFAAKRASGVQEEALAFVRLLLDAPIPRIALENPVSIISTRIRAPDQVVQPYEYGDPFFKTTCLWIKGLPLLKATNHICIPPAGSVERKSWEMVHRMPPGQDRWKERSRTFKGLADAFADQYGSVNDTRRHAGRMKPEQLNLTEQF